mgnify:CR=1 FL=1
MAESKYIEIKGAREHNLKNVNISIPKNQLTVITGLSGSGKSSLAFDTIYAEGQRRYVESLSAYARQFLDLMKKPDVDSIEGLAPAISIEQKTTSHNPRSTVGTITEIYDYMRLLWARAGTPYSPATGLPIEAQTVSQMVDKILSLPAGTKIMLVAPMVRQRKGEFKKELDGLLKQGFQRVKIDGEVYDFNGNSCIVIGGAYSVDKYYRLARGWSWFPDEQPSEEIKAKVERVLAERNWKIDIVLSHTGPLKYEPTEVFLPMIDQSTVDKSTEVWLEQIEAKLDYERWYFAHYHTEKEVGKIRIMHNDYTMIPHEASVAAEKDMIRRMHRQAEIAEALGLLDDAPNQKNGDDIS